MGDRPFVVRGEELRIARGRGLYLTEDCKRTGLPLLTPDMLRDPAWSRLRLPWERRNNGFPVRAGEEPVAFKVTKNGASPLYTDGRLPSRPIRLPEPEEPCPGCPGAESCRGRIGCRRYIEYTNKREDARRGREAVRQRGLVFRTEAEKEEEDKLRRIAEKIPWRKEDTPCEEK